MIQAHEDQFAMRLMCRAMRVLPSGYYDWRDRPPAAQTQAREQLDQAVQQALTLEKGRAGAPRLTRRLKAQRQRAGRRQIAQSLRRQGLCAEGAHKYKGTTNSNHSLPAAPNLLQQDFSATRLNQKWVSVLPISPPTRVGCIWPW